TAPADASHEKTPRPAPGTEILLPLPLDSCMLPPPAPGFNEDTHTREGCPMSSNHTFAAFLSRVRQGDEEAAAALVRQFEPVIRREVRMRLTDPALYRLVDSVDICQWVLLGFFVRAAAGQYDLAGPRDLCNLLLTMAQNKVASEARKQRRRDAVIQRVDLEQTEEQAPLCDGRPSPGRVSEG